MFIQAAYRALLSMLPELDKLSNSTGKGYPIPKKNWKAKRNQKRFANSGRKKKSKR